MSVKLNFQRDTQGYNAYAPQQASDKYSATIAAGGHATVTVPSNFQNWIAAFSYAAGGDFWVSVGGTAAAPAGATFASTTSQLNPGALSVQKAQVIDVLNNGAGSSDVGVVFYAIS